MRITITVPEDVADAAHQAVTDGAARSVSAYFSAAARDTRATETMHQMLADWTTELGPVPDDVATSVAEQWRHAGIDPAAKQTAAAPTPDRPLPRPRTQPLRKAARKSAGHRKAG